VHVQQRRAGTRVAGLVEVDLERVDQVAARVLLDQLPQPGRHGVWRQPVQRQVHEQPVDAQLVIADHLPEARYGLGHPQAHLGERAGRAGGVQAAHHGTDPDPDRVWRPCVLADLGAEPACVRAHVVKRGRPQRRREQQAVAAGTGDGDGLHRHQLPDQPLQREIELRRGVRPALEHVGGDTHGEQDDLP
jgi:hypothetical protein